MKTRKIVYAAVSAALAATVITLCAYMPVKLVPLIFVSAAYYVALDKCGYFGLIAVAASMLIAFFAGGGFQTSFVLTTILFAPYAVLAYAMRRVGYTSAKNIALRCVCMTVLFVASGILTLVLSQFITGVSLETIVEKVGKWVIIALFAVVAVPTDYFFRFAMFRVCSVLGMGEK